MKGLLGPADHDDAHHQKKYGQGRQLNITTLDEGVLLIPRCMIAATKVEISNTYAKYVFADKANKHGVHKGTK